MLTLASGLFIASGFCFAAGKPTDFLVAGFEPRNLLNSSAVKDEYRTRLLISVTQDRIDHNRAAIAHAAQQISAAMIAAGVSIGAAALEFVAALTVLSLF
jgi:hypothetical protein